MQTSSEMFNVISCLYQKKKSNVLNLYCKLSNSEVCISTLCFDVPCYNKAKNYLCKSHKYLKNINFIYNLRHCIYFNSNYSKKLTKLHVFGDLCIYKCNNRIYKDIFCKKHYMMKSVFYKKILLQSNDTSETIKHILHPFFIKSNIPYEKDKFTSDLIEDVNSYHVNVNTTPTKDLFQLVDIIF